MKNPWRTAIALLGQAILLACPAQLQAHTTLSELKEQVRYSTPLQEDALLFHTNEAKVLVLADKSGKIGAVLLHSKTRRSDIRALVDNLQSLISHTDRPPQVSLSDDRHSALILYPCDKDSLQDATRAIVGCDRLTALHNACNSYNGNITPHYWHGSGISLRNYDNDLLYEITLDMSTERVEYAEIRMGKRGKSFLKAHMLTGIPPNLPLETKQIRRISYRLGGATPIHADETGDIYVSRDRCEVYTVGSQQRLQLANKSRNDIKHYIFPALNIPGPTAVFTLRPKPHSQPIPPTPKPKEEQAPPTPKPAEQPPALTPEQARRAYIEQLQKI